MMKSMLMEGSLWRASLMMLFFCHADGARHRSPPRRMLGSHCKMSLRPRSLCCSSAGGCPRWWRWRLTGDTSPAAAPASACSRRTATGSAAPGPAAGTRFRQRWRWTRPVGYAAGNPTSNVPAARLPFLSFQEKIISVKLFQSLNSSDSPVESVDADR